MVIDFHVKNQVNICKRLGKKSGKLILTDGLTERKPKVPFGFASRGLKRTLLRTIIANSWIICSEYSVNKA